MRHRHTTPFEMCEIKYHVKLPIFVARQWIRHRTANVNEYSARYSILDNEFYIPAPEQLAAQSTTNRQGRGDVLEGDEAAARARPAARRCRARLSRLCRDCSTRTRPARRVDPGRPGLARELARMNLSLNFYTQWYWKTDLHNLMHFLSLRADRARAVRDPRLCRRDARDARALGPADRTRPSANTGWAARISRRTALAVVKRLLAGERVDQAESGLCKREWRELMAVLGRGRR